MQFSQHGKATKLQKRPLLKSRSEIGTLTDELRPSLGPNLAPNSHVLLPIKRPLARIIVVLNLAPRRRRRRRRMFPPLAVLVVQALPARGVDGFSDAPIPLLLNPVPRGEERAGAGRRGSSQEGVPLAPQLLLGRLGPYRGEVGGGGGGGLGRGLGGEFSGAQAGWVALRVGC